MLQLSQSRVSGVNKETGKHASSSVEGGQSGAGRLRVFGCQEEEAAPQRLFSPRRPVSKGNISQMMEAGDAHLTLLSSP